MTSGPVLRHRQAPTCGWLLRDKTGPGINCVWNTISPSLRTYKKKTAQGGCVYQNLQSCTNSRLERDPAQSLVLVHTVHYETLVALSARVLSQGCKIRGVHSGANWDTIYTSLISSPGWHAWILQACLPKFPGTEKGKNLMADRMDQYDAFVKVSLLSLELVYG